MQAPLWPLSSLFFSCHVFLVWGVNMWKKFSEPQKRKRYREKLLMQALLWPLFSVCPTKSRLQSGEEKTTYCIFPRRDFDSLFVLNLFMGKVANFYFSKWLDVCCFSIIFCASLQCSKLCCFENLTRIPFKNINTRNVCMLAKRKILA